MRAFLILISAFAVVACLSVHFFLVWMWILDAGRWLSPMFWVLGVWAVITARLRKTLTILVVAAVCGLGMALSSAWFLSICLRSGPLCVDPKADASEVIFNLAGQAAFYSAAWSIAIVSARASRSIEQKH